MGEESVGTEFEGAGFGFFQMPRVSLNRLHCTVKGGTAVCKISIPPEIFIASIVVDVASSEKFFSSNYFPLDRVLVSSLAYNNAGEQISCVAIYIFEEEICFLQRSMYGGADTL